MQFSAPQETNGLKTSSFSMPAAAVAFVTAAVFAVTSIAQTPQTAPGPGGPPQQHNYPAPTNLKVLPKDLTAQQVHEIMEKWAGGLGVHCNTCHVADTKNVGPNGRPRLNFADDSKEEKQTARIMYKMTEDINANYVSKVPSSDMAVTCGTCHRGHLSPEPFVAPEEHHGPPPSEGQPPAGATPPSH